MAVDRTHNLNHQTRYELSNDGAVAATLAYTAEPGEPATWKILLPGPTGPRTCTAPAAPPPSAGWR